MTTQTFLAKLSLLFLRLGLGGLFLWSGLEKLFAPKAWTAAGFLKNVEGPFKVFFVSLAGGPVVDWLVVWGLTLIGVVLILGIFVRLSSFFGALMMLLFYLASLPVEHGPIDNHIIYILALFVLSALGAGRIWGLDQPLEKFLAEKNLGNWRKILG